MLLHCQYHRLGHVIKMPHRVHYNQIRIGHRSVGVQKKHFKDHIKSILKKCNIPFNRLEALASNRATGQSTCAIGMSIFDTEYDRAAALTCCRIYQHAAVPRLPQDSAHQCPCCGRQCNSRIGLHGHSKTHI